MKTPQLIHFILMVLAMQIALNSHAQLAPPAANYQGRLTDGNGNNVADGNGYEIEIRLWPSATGGTTPIWGARYAGVTVKNGALNLALGSASGTAIPGAVTTDLKTAFANPTIFLGLTVTKGASGAPVGSPSEILPRQQWMSAPFAFRAEIAAAVAPGSITSTMLADASVTGSKVAPDSIDGTKIAAQSISNTHISPGTISPDRLAPSFAIISEQLASGASSQAAKNGWQKRLLNTLEQNSGSDIAFSDASDRFTLGFGTYEIEAHVPYYSNWTVFGSYGCRHRAALHRVSTDSLHSLTPVAFSDQLGSNYSGGFTGGVLTVKTVVTVGSTTTPEEFELFHHIQDTSSRNAIGTVGAASSYGGCGMAASIDGVPEVYSRVYIKRVK